MESRDNKSVPIPWQGMLTLVAALGVYLYYKPLDTSRPIEKSSYSAGSVAQQDVEARLWQDPLLAAYSHANADMGKSPQGKCKNPQLHNAGALIDEIGKEKLWILPVMVVGGSYVEYNEIRLRARRAVLEALGTCGFAPRDGEHIGYVDWNFSTPGQSPPSEDLLPFEWCDRRTHHVVPATVKGASQQDNARVLILWLRDELFYQQPLAQLNEFVCRLTSENPNAVVRLIGPRTSTGMRAMLREAAGRKADKSPTLSYLSGVRMICPTTTASEEALLFGIETKQGSSKDLLESQASRFIFDRLTTTDGQVSEALVAELMRRNVKLALTKSEKKKAASRATEAEREKTKKKYEAKFDHIALISEWDTFYGSILPQTFIRALPSAKPGPFSIQPPENITVYHYLRGIDGVVPDPSGKSPETTAERRLRQPNETTEGVNQADYLRRLAVQLLEKDRKLRKEGKDGIKAIGVLGTDIYDKLLVLKSLRSLFPGALYFTTSLDARFANPDEWTAARNLIVGSPFGLTLTPKLQARIPPFRDSYQTATYAATLAALDEELVSGRNSSGDPRIFEIGRNGAFDLTPPAKLSTSKTRVPASVETSLHPVNPRTAIWFTWNRAGLIAGLLALSTLALLWSLAIIRGVQSCSGLGRSSWTFAVVAAFVSWLVIYIIAICQMPEGEPFAWFEGVSIWPTEILRFFIFLMAVWFVWKTNNALAKSEEAIEKEFGLEPSDKIPWPQAKFLSREWRSQAIALLTVGCWPVERNKKVIAQELWNYYIPAGNLAVRLIRVTPLVLFYMGAGFCLMGLLGFPPVPGRGLGSFCLDRTFLILAVFLSVGVTFYIVDATMLNRRLIEYLTKEETEWPVAAYASLRKRWSSASQTRREEEKEKSESVARPPDKILAEYLDIDLIAKRTKVVGGLIYYPFILLSLLIVSRLALFDNWTWPVPLLIVIALTGGYAAWSAFRLRETAESARQTALGNLNDILIARTADGEGDKAEARTARETIAIIKAEDRGAFAAISRHPVFGALLLPSGGVGIWALTQYLPNLF